jgi:hypothetical protein
MRLGNWFAVVLVSCPLHHAFAQETPAPSPPAAPLAVFPDAPPQDLGGRFRFGLSANLGWNIPSAAFAYGAEARLGYQATPSFAAYLAVGGMSDAKYDISAGCHFDACPGEPSWLWTLRYLYAGAFAEFILADRFYVGGGLVGAGGSYDYPAETVHVTATGFKPGVDVRFGVALGRREAAPSFRWHAFTIGLDVLVLFHPNAAYTNLSDPVRYGTSVSVTPILALGYDGR